jgi:ribonuclease BN (tRNA processing enzyme)
MIAPVELVILGSGTLEQLPWRGPAAHLLRGSDSPPVLLDSGPGCLDRLARLGADPLELAAAVHSHLHLDHLADLFPLLFQRCMAEQRLPQLVLSGAPGHEGRLIQVTKALYPRLLQTNLGFHEIASNGRPHPLPGTPYRVRAFPASHSESARILRIEGDSPSPWSVAYSGDTGPCPGLQQAAEGADWLVVECTTPDDGRREGHLCPEDVAAVIDEARPRGTALVHLSPLWRKAEDAAAVVRAHLGTLRPGEVPYVVAGADGLALPLPFGQPYHHPMDAGATDELA